MQRKGWQKVRNSAELYINGSNIGEILIRLFCSFNESSRSIPLLCQPQQTFSPVSAGQVRREALKAKEPGDE